MIFGWQVFEYHPAPWDQWVTVGNILVARQHETILTVGPQELPCLSAGHEKPKPKEVISAEKFRNTH